LATIGRVAAKLVHFSSDLADIWRRATCFNSFWHMCTTDPAYAKLVSYGSALVPFVLRRLLSGDHSFRWSCLLHELTGETPDYEREFEDGMVKFNVNAAAEAWLKWGREHGFLDG